MAAEEGSALDVQVLAAVGAAEGPISTLALADKLGDTHQKLVGVVKSLGSDEYLAAEPKSRTQQVLTAAGTTAVEAGSPEAVVFNSVAVGEGATIADVQAAVGAAVYKAGFGPAMRLKWLAKNGANLVRVQDSITDTVQEQLKSIASGTVADAKTIKLLSKRKLAKEECVLPVRLATPIPAGTRHLPPTGQQST